MSLFDVLKRVAADRPDVAPEGELDIANRLRLALIAAIKQCPLSRHQIAGEMSHLLGHEVTKTTIDSWTAESKERNRIPAEYLPAFYRVTGDRGAIRLPAEHGGNVCHAWAGGVAGGDPEVYGTGKQGQGRKAEADAVSGRNETERGMMMKRKDLAEKIKKQQAEQMKERVAQIQAGMGFK